MSKPIKRTEEKERHIFSYWSLLVLSQGRITVTPERQDSGRNVIINLVKF